MAFLSRESIFAHEDILSEVVEVPEWGGSVKVRSLTGEQVDAYQNARLVMKGDSQEYNTKKARAQLVAFGCIDESGSRLFNTAGDVDKLGKKSNKALERVADVIARLSGLKKEALKDAGEDSGADPSADSTSA